MRVVTNYIVTNYNYILTNYIILYFRGGKEPLSFGLPPAERKFFPENDFQKCRIVES